ncbi:hypothetical protein IM40_05975 [Candidatus Paracaedimonas acanthamoebae]|nr:hypothetical protein IM40_05975 [Candidatus Paracaedimonas acanthamoebae]
MNSKQVFIKKLQEKFQSFDKNLSYITSASGDRFISKKLLISKKLDDINSHLQEAFDIYKKIKLSKEEDWNELHPLASKTFHKLTKEFSILIKDIKKKKMNKASLHLLKKGKIFLHNLQLYIKKRPCTSMLTALSVGFTFGKAFIAQGKNTKFS